MDIQKIMRELTPEEKILLVSGTNNMYTNAIMRLGIPSLCFADGPHGLRKQTAEGSNATEPSEPATAFPTASLTACGFRADNLYRMGEAIGRECLHYGVDLLLGPGINIKRNPLCGRNFEYFSEDPLLASEMAIAEIRGVQSTGVGTSLKHFALNNTENHRFDGDSIADERTMREIYLRPFERAVKDAAPDTLMCAYNKVGGIFASENKWLLDDLLRGEWGFSGAVMSDWGAVHRRDLALLAGMDLEMPGDTNIAKRTLFDRLGDPEVSEALERSVMRILTLIDKYEAHTAHEVDFDAHHRLAEEIAADCAVLLKNNEALPLSRDEELLVVGELFSKMRYQGAGSSMICPTRLVSPKDAFDARGIRYTYVRGYTEGQTKEDEALLVKACESVKSGQRVLLFLGLTDEMESEGVDRAHMRLPENQLRLVNALLALNARISVVLYGGSAVELPFVDKIDSLLCMFLPGQAGGEATAKLLFGEISPSGRLAETFRVEVEALPFHENYGKTPTELYKEGVFVGYRGCLAHKESVQFPFGFGLSYTSFSYRDLAIEDKGESLFAALTVENTGNADASHAILLFFKKENSMLARPERELCGFDKIFLSSGESRRVTVEIPKERLVYYHTGEHRFVLEDGEYIIEAALDAHTPVLCHTVSIAGETLPLPIDEMINEIYRSGELHRVSDELFEKLLKRPLPEQTPALPFTMESRFADLSLTRMGRLISRLVLSVPESQMKKAMRLPEGAERDNRIKGATFYRRMIEMNTLNGMSMGSGGMLPYHVAQGLLTIANGHPVRGAFELLRPIRLPKGFKTKK